MVAASRAPSAAKATPTSPGPDTTGRRGAAGVEPVDRARTGQRLDDVQHAVRIEREALRPAEGRIERLVASRRVEAVHRVVGGQRRRRHVEASRRGRRRDGTPPRSAAAWQRSRPVRRRDSRGESTRSDRRRRATRRARTRGRRRRRARRRTVRVGRRRRCDRRRRRNGSTRGASRRADTARPVAFTMPSTNASRPPSGETR